jgi:integral membrane protein (TIGR01906 family)
VLLVLASVRLLMTPAFLYFEYTRPGFPEDIYGFTVTDRLRYAPYAIDYLLNGEDITYLSSLRFPDGRSLFNVRELQHMRDVKVVTQLAYLVAVIAGLIGLFSIFWLGKDPSTRRDLYAGLFHGSLLTLGMIGAIVLAAIVNWDFFFTGFHTLFFESGTWRFAYSDTLIRLFPEQFWFDAALLIGGMTTLSALVILLVTWRWKTRI